MVYAMDQQVIRNDWVGQVIDDRFPLLQWLGGSEHSSVFLTELRGPGSQHAAIKLIPADAVGAEAQIAAWAATSTLSHPHLMHLLHTGRCVIGSAPKLYAVTEFAEENLSQILLERPLTPTEVREMISPIIDALSYLHGRGLVHGHLKPSNIMVVDDQLRISSDNLSVAGEPGKRFPSTEVHEAPESVAEAIFPAADMWSLGVTLIEALTQLPPVWDRSIMSEPTVPASIPQPFAGIAQECLRFDPQRRCTISDIKARLEPAKPIPVPDPPSKKGRKFPAKLRLTAIVSAIIVILAAIVVLQLRSPKTEPSPQTGEPESSAITPLQPPSPGSATQSSKGTVVTGAVTKRVLPDISQRASETIRGRFELTIRAAVDPNGNVSNAVLDSPGPSKYFANLALQAAQNWRFKPPQVDGRAVSSVWLLQFQFSQTATEVTPVEESP